MKHQPKVSVIIPTFKTAKYLSKCIDSVLKQTFQDFEIILVSDGPKEDDDICDRYAKKDKRISVLKNIRKGLGGARNAGIQKAKGIFILFVDSDDTISPKMIEKMVYAMENNPVDLVHCGTNIIYKCEASPELQYGDATYFEIKKSGIKALDNDLFGRVDIAVWNKLYRKSLIEKYHLTFPENMYNEDAYFSWAYMSICKNIYYLPEHLYNYSRREGSLMQLTFNKTLGEKALDHLRVGRLFYEFLKKNHLQKKLQEGFFNAYVVCVWYSFNHSPQEYKKEAYQMAHGFLHTFSTKEIIGRHAGYLKKIRKEKYNEFSQIERPHYTKYKLFGFFDLISVFKTEHSFKIVLCKLIPLIEYRERK